MGKNVVNVIAGISLLLYSCSPKVVYIESLPEKQPQKIEEKEKSLYQKELEEKIKGLIGSPIVPIRTPPTIVRILFLPYSSKTGELVLSHYVYMKIDDGKWVLGDYLIDNPIRSNPSQQIVNPLSADIELKKSAINEQTKKQEKTENYVEKTLETIGVKEKKQKGIYEEENEE